MKKDKIPLFKVFMPESVKDKLIDTLFSGYIAEGEKTAKFTSLVSNFIENPRTLLVNSGTTALQIAYRLANVGVGDEVISTPLTSIATNVPILSLGAKPIWADVNPKTGLSDPKDIAKLINKRTKAIVVLHKDGDIDDLDEINDIAKKNNIKVIEDAAHAFGAKYNNKMIGNHGDFVCFSFQAIKHITTGDGGALACKNEIDYQRAKKLKWFGIDHDNKGLGNPWLNDINEIGYKGNMNDIAATIGIEQIKNIDKIIEKFHSNGLLYSKILKDMDIPGIKLVKRNSEVFSTYWLYTLLSENRDDLVKFLNENGIGAGQVHPRNDVWSIFESSKRNLPNVDYFSERELSLPCGWWVEKEDIEMICNIIRKFGERV